MQAYKRNKLGIDLKIDNYKDVECYKVELSKQEYVELLLEIDKLKDENYKQILAYEQKMEIEQAKAERKFLEMKKNLSADISFLKDRIANDTEYKKLVMQQKNDSCVDRGVSKKSSGYFFLDAIEWREKVSGYHQKIVTWKYVIQTPFLSTYPHRTVEDAVLDMLEEKILPECGCKHWVDGNDIGDFYSLTFSGRLKDEYVREPYVYDWKMRANFVRGYWEIELFITGELEIPTKYQIHYCQKNRVDELKKLNERL